MPSGTPDLHIKIHDKNVKDAYRFQNTEEDLEIESPTKTIFEGQEEFAPWLHPTFSALDVETENKTRTNLKNVIYLERDDNTTERN